MLYSFLIRDGQQSDATRVADIYNYYIKNSAATFQEQLVDEHYTCDKVNKCSINSPFIVATQADNKVVGFAYADAFRSRCSYRYVHEISIYVDIEKQQQGIGNLLMESLIQRMRTSDVHKLLAVISLPNPASVGLHERHGFVQCGILPAVAWKFNQWWDCGYWLLDLNKTSLPR